MKNTMLSQKDAVFLQEAIARYGRIATFAQLAGILKKEYSHAQIKNRLSLLAKVGWLLRIKKGLYAVITDIGSLAASALSFFTLAQALNKDSYISFENALQHHGLFDQALANITSVTFKRGRRYNVKGTQIKIFKIKKELYFGFTSERSDIGLVNIAEKEKAILDILYFSSSEYHISLIWEKLKEYKEDFNFDILKRYAVRFGINMARKIGFFTDRLNIQNDDLLKAIKGKTSYAKLTRDSSVFDAKWRLYFDPEFVK